MGHRCSSKRLFSNPFAVACSACISVGPCTHNRMLLTLLLDFSGPTFSFPFKQYKAALGVHHSPLFSHCFSQITMSARLISTCVGPRAFARTLRGASPVNARGASHSIRVVPAVKVGTDLSCIQLKAPCRDDAINL